MLLGGRDTRCVRRDCRTLAVAASSGSVAQDLLHDFVGCRCGAAVAKGRLAEAASMIVVFVVVAVIVMILLAASACRLLIVERERMLSMSSTLVLLLVIGSMMV